MTVKTEGGVSASPAARASGKGSVRAGTMEQPSRADRVARGKEARRVAPLESHAEFAPAGSRDPVGLLLEQAKSPGAGAGADPPRADAGVAVHVLPGSGAADGGGPGHHARVGAAGAAVRGCAPVQFRGVRLAGAAPGLRRQRLRRDPARPVRVGRQAAGRQPGRGGPGQRVPRQDPPQDRPGGGRGLPHGDARLRQAAAAGRLVRPPGHRAGHRRAPGPGQGGTIQGCRGLAGQGAHPGQHPGAGQAHHRGRRAAADHQRPADDRARRRGLRRCGRPTRSTSSSAPCWASTGAPCSRTGGTCWSSSRWSRWPARSSGSAASAPAPGSC